MRLSSEITISKVVHRGRNVWRVKYPDPNGGPRRKRDFKKKTGSGGAEEWVESQQSEISAGGVENQISTLERTVIAQNRERIEATGMSLRKVIELGLEQYAKMVQSASVSDTIKKFITLKTKVGTGKRQMTDYRLRLGRFEEEFGDRIISTISSEEIDDWLLSLENSRSGEPISKQTWKNYRANLKALFGQALKWKLVIENAVLDTEAPKIGDGEPGILTPKEAQLMLENADEAILPGIAISLFAGLRRSELEKLNWQDVLFSESPSDETHGAIHFKGGKTNQWRDITIRPTLSAWLLPHRKDSGPVWPTLYGRELFDEARRKAGFAIQHRTKGAERVEGKPWPQNAFRHSFASYLLKIEQNDRAVALEMGHRRDTSMLFRHYRRLVLDKDAKEFWGLQPENFDESNITSFEQYIDGDEQVEK